MSVFIQAILFVVFFIVSYYMVLPNLVLSGIVSLLSVNAISNAKVVYGLLDYIDSRFWKCDSLHGEKNQAIAELEERVRDLEDKLELLEGQVDALDDKDDEFDIG